VLQKETTRLDETDRMFEKKLADADKRLSKQIDEN
jgi:hypothetical protein